MVRLDHGAQADDFSFAESLPGTKSLRLGFLIASHRELIH
jgi:hypothetical protein